MTAANIMKFDTIIVEIVENCQARLITLSVIWLCTSSTENFWSEFLVCEWKKSYPPVCDHSTLLWDLPEGHLILVPLTRPPVQKNLWPSLANKFLNSCSFDGLSRLIALIPLDLQKASPWLSVKSLQPILQLSKKFCPPNWWLGEFPPPHRPEDWAPNAGAAWPVGPRFPRNPPKKFPRNPNWGKGFADPVDTMRERTAAMAVMVEWCIFKGLWLYKSTWTPAINIKFMGAASDFHRTVGHFSNSF